MTARNSAATRPTSVLAGLAFGLLLAASPTSPLLAEDLSGELVILQWQGGVEAELWKKLEDAFVAKHPGVTVRELVVTGQGDMRGAMRTALLGGEIVDLIINTWPAFRAELLSAGLLRPLDEQWDAMKWGDRLGQSWRDLGSIDGATYGITYTYGDRSGVWYKPATWRRPALPFPRPGTSSLRPSTS